MKSYLIPGLALGLLLNSVAAQDKPDLTNPKQRGSYALGANFAMSLKRQGFDIDPKAYAAGATDALTAKPLLSRDEMQQALETLQKGLADKYGNAEKNLKEGEAFLAANAKKEGIKTTASGLQYKVLKQGSGESPKAEDTVKVHYHGTLIDGSIFDSSVERGEPVEFPLNGVIPGWTEGVQLMKVGDKFQFFIPGKLAYGEQGRGGMIGPNTSLIFEVELLGVTRKK